MHVSHNAHYLHFFQDLNNLNDFLWLHCLLFLSEWLTTTCPLSEFHLWCLWTTFNLYLECFLQSWMISNPAVTPFIYVISFQLISSMIQYFFQSPPITIGMISRGWEWCFVQLFHLIVLPKLTYIKLKSFQVDLFGSTYILKISPKIYLIWLMLKFEGYSTKVSEYATSFKAK